MSGVLKGNESVTLVIAFSPSELYEYKLTFSTYPVGGETIR
eukprot:gene25375-33915_t